MTSSLEKVLRNYNTQFGFLAIHLTKAPLRVYQGFLKGGITTDSRHSPCQLSAANLDRDPSQVCIFRRDQFPLLNYKILTPIMAVILKLRS